MHVKSFIPLFEIYQDFDASPTIETIDKIENRVNQPDTDYYCMQDKGNPSGEIRIVTSMKNWVADKQVRLKQ